MSGENDKEQGFKWWLRYVIMPLAIACIGGGGITALIVAFIPLVFPTSPSLPATKNPEPVSQVGTIPSTLPSPSATLVPEQNEPTSTPKPADTWTPTSTPKPADTWTPTFTPIPPTNTPFPPTPVPLTNTPIPALPISSSLCPDTVPRSTVSTWGVGAINVGDVQPYLDKYEVYRKKGGGFTQGDTIPSGVIIATDFGNGESEFWQTYPVEPIVPSSKEFCGFG